MIKKRKARDFFSFFYIPGQADLDVNAGDPNPDVSSRCEPSTPPPPTSYAR